MGALSFFEDLNKYSSLYEVKKYYEKCNFLAYVQGEWFDFYDTRATIIIENGIVKNEDKYGTFLRGEYEIEDIQEDLSTNESGVCMSYKLVLCEGKVRLQFFCKDDNRDVGDGRLYIDIEGCTPGQNGTIYTMPFILGREDYVRQWCEHHNKFFLGAEKT